MRSWSWPNPVYLVKPFDADLGLVVWHASMNPWHIMPIITPAYPSMNSSVSVSSHSLAVIMEEFVRGDEICCKAIEAAGKGEWDTVDSVYLSLVEPSDFFIKYPHYVAVSSLYVGWLHFIFIRSSVSLPPYPLTPSLFPSFCDFIALYRLTLWLGVKEISALGMAICSHACESY